MTEEIRLFLKQAVEDLNLYRENKVCVVSIVSKSPLNECLEKGALLNQLIERRIFPPYASLNKFESCKIDAFFDTDSQCVFLNLRSPYELNAFDFRKNSEVGYHQWWADKEKEFASHLLYLFSISQIVLFVHPTCRFDLGYLRLFRNLNYLREKSLSAVQDILSNVSSVPKGWWTEGRACCPRVLFLFSRPPSFMKPDGTVETKKGSYKKLAACLEDQIYRLFRKSRVITNNTSNSICSLPPKQPFCYIFGPNEEPKEFGQEILSNLLRSGNNSAEDKKSDYEEFGFKNFFFDHLDLALSSGFDDNFGKTGAAYFELPRLKSFLRVATELHDLFITRWKDNKDLSELNDLVDVVTKFSESRCSKVYPIAVASYQDSLPMFYNEIQHRAKLLQAIQVLRQQARGPCLEKAVTKLAQECDVYWRNGRQACEMYSLTGNICSNRLHRLSQKDVESGDLPVMWHTSKVRYLSTCNCGRRQAWRDDPFEIYEANFAFYELNKDFACCDRLQRLEIPVYIRKRATVVEKQPADVKNETTTNEEEKIKNEGTTRVRKISVEDLFERFQLGAAATQEETKSTNPGRDDFLPDRDNRPASNKLLTSSPRQESPLPLNVNEDIINNLQNKETANEANPEPSFSLTLLNESDMLTGARNINLPKVNTQDDMMLLPDRDNNIGSLSEGAGTGSQLSELLRNNMLDEICRQRSSSGSNPSLVDDDENATAGIVQHEEENCEPEAQNSDVAEEIADELVSDVLERVPDAEQNWWSAVDKADKDSCNVRHSVGDEDFEDDDGFYLPGMVHNLCQPGLLPLFPSWTLICIGHSSIYSHSTGLRDNPNFTHGSSFLLPWDVTLTGIDLERWHDLMELMATSSKRPGVYKKPRLPLNIKDGTVSVKVFIGFEYECPRGHRFIMQTPEKMLRHSGSGGGPKDNGAEVTLNDMPLWFPCNCKQTQGQLTRIHVITPKAPVLVALNPRIQPHVNAPLFTPGFLTPPRLGPAQYWILRLPMVYVGPDGPYYPPKEEYHPVGRILKSAITIIPDM